MQTITAIRIPKAFYDDCVQCETRTPVIVHETKAHYWVDLDSADPDFPGETSVETWQDFRGRAKYYADPIGFDEWTTKTICPSARATIKAIESPKARIFRRAML